MVPIFRSSCINLTKRFFPREISCLNKKYLNRHFFHTSTFLNVKGTDIKMPSLSPTMTVGTIVKWYKKEGDVIAPGDVLCDIQTDKAVMSFETEEEGVLAKVLIPEGTNEVEVGTLIGLIVGEGEDWKNVDIPAKSGSSAETSENINYEESDVSGTQSIMMPSLSPTMSEGTIVKWCKKEGDIVAPGDVLCDIQTDKAVMSFETEEEGILAKILVAEGSTGIQVGSLIALIVPEGTDWQNVRIPSPKTSTTVVDEKLSSNDNSRAAEVNKNITDSLKVNSYWPAVRVLLELYQIDPSKITATGRNNRLLKSDVLNYITSNKLQPKPAISVPLPKSASSPSHSSDIYSHKRTIEKYTDIELSSMRKTIANRLTTSKKTIPHAYATTSSQVSDLLALRKQMKVAGINVSVNDFVIKAVALSLKQCPYVNKLYVNEEVISASDIDISVAVATESGLITPIVKNADEKNVDEISNEVKELAQKARVGKLQLHEFQGGSFTISNLGMFGISEFSAIINPPQCAILAVGGGRPFVDTNKNASVKMTATLSYDSRAISESAAADFLETLQWFLQNPVNLIMGSTKKADKRYA